MKKSKIKGHMSFTSFANDTLPTELAINNVAPTGGVIPPKINVSTITIPKWIGSKPKLAAKGWKIGTMMIAAGVVSIKQPIHIIAKIIRNIMI